MANTPRFLHMERNIQQVQTQYLPETNEDGTYSQDEQNNMKAYAIFVHAEIESFFEDVCKAKVLTAFTEWQNDRTASNVLLALVSHYPVTFRRGNEQRHDLEARIQRAFNQYKHDVDNNHGVKSEHILALALPAGVEKQRIDSIDSTWLDSMTGFGAKRGKLAHSSLMSPPHLPSTVGDLLDPVQLRSEIQSIVDRMRYFDEVLQQVI